MNGNLIQRLHSMSCPPQYFAFYVNKTTKSPKTLCKKISDKFLNKQKWCSWIWKNYLRIIIAESITKNAQ